MLHDLRQCFSHQLPGLDAQLTMAPPHRKEDLQLFLHYREAKKSSVLIIFFEESGIYNVVFIKRTEYNGAHSGQISFPGGKWEKSDIDLYHTALRESEEEIGIDTSLVTYCGKLTDLYIPPSNFIVSPFVVVYNKRVPFKPDPSEVAEILEIPFNFLLTPNAVQQTTIKISNGYPLLVPCFNFQENIIWGATAMIMSEMINLWKTTVQFR